MNMGPIRTHFMSTNGLIRIDICTHFGQSSALNNVLTRIICSMLYYYRISESAADEQN